MREGERDRGRERKEKGREGDIGELGRGESERECVRENSSLHDCMYLLSDSHSPTMTLQWLDRVCSDATRNKPLGSRLEYFENCVGGEGVE